MHRFMSLAFAGHKSKQNSLIRSFSIQRFSNEPFIQ